MNSNFLLTEDDGEPLGVIDMDLVHDAGTRLAFRLAASCGDPAALDRILAETLTAVGSKGFGYVAASALRVLAEHVLDPSLTAGEAAGVHLRAGLTALADGRDPMQAG